MRVQSSARWRTDNLELFVLEPAHVTDTYVEWLNDVQVNRFLESRFAVHDVASVRAFISKALEDPDVLFLGIHNRELSRHVGNVKLALNRHHGLGEVGIMIGDREAWGRGVATQAIERVADIAAHELGLRKLTAGCYASNAASARAFEKAGFRVEGTRAQHFLLDGRPEDLVLMARLLR